MYKIDSFWSKFEPKYTLIINNPQYVERRSNDVK